MPVWSAPRDAINATGSSVCMCAPVGGLGRARLCMCVRAEDTDTANRETHGARCYSKRLPIFQTDTWEADDFKSTPRVPQHVTGSSLKPTQAASRPRECSRPHCCSPPTLVPGYYPPTSPASCFLSLDQQFPRIWLPGSRQR